MNKLEQHDGYPEEKNTYFRVRDVFHSIGKS